MKPFYALPDLATTEHYGRKLGALIFPGATIALNGELGAGKTHFTRAVVEGLGGDPSQVTSPTFVLIQEYAARLPIYHFDFYRLKNADELRDLGCEEYFCGQGVCIIEWASKFADCLPADYLALTIVPTPTAERAMTPNLHGERHRPLLSMFD